MTKRYINHARCDNRRRNINAYSKNEINKSKEGDSYRRRKLGFRKGGSGARGAYDIGIGLDVSNAASFGDCWCARVRASSMRHIPLANASRSKEPILSGSHSILSQPG